jgi:hypothetical protein
VLAFDHIIVAVRDLEAAAKRLWNEHGLGSVPGGRHPGHGTGNRIIPLGTDYLELMAVVDAAEASRSPLGRFVTAFTESGDRPMAVCLRTDDIASLADRLGLTPLPMTRTRPDGIELSWDLAGLDDALGDDRLPFFIQWHVAAADHPGRATADHAIPVEGLAWVECGGDRRTFDRRLGEHDLDIRFGSGAPGPHAFGVKTPTGELRL